MAVSFAFEGFVIDPRDRRLSSGDRTVELNGRYFDALALLVRDHGQLVSKDRFMAEVWRGIPVTDEALTQCIRTLRRQLGDDAARPRFIETVPKHGYRFIAPVQELVAAREAGPANASTQWSRFAATGAAGTVGGGVAGAIGGLIYGFAGASQAGSGAISVLLVLLCIMTLIALIGAAGVSFAIAAAVLARANSWPWLTLAGAGGGLVIGALTKLLGLDAFTLLVGRSPGPITGASEGLLLGAAVGIGLWLALQSQSVRRGAALAGLAGVAGGIVIALLGGRLMLGSLALLAHGFPGSRLQLDQIGQLFGESGLGPVTQAVSAGLEGGLFSACIATAMMVARRAFGKAA